MHDICEFDLLYVGIGAAIARVSVRFWKRFERKMVSDGKDLKNIYIFLEMLFLPLPRVLAALVQGCQTQFSE